MSLQEKTPRTIDVTNDEPEPEHCVIDSIINATPPPSSTARIHRVPIMIRDTGDYEKYYVPKVVSIGPYHFGNPKLECVEKLKPIFAKKLLDSNKETLRGLYQTLGEPEMVKELRNFYEENSTKNFCDKVFTKMMLLDSCFVLYYILFILGGKQEILGGKQESCRELRSHQIVFVHQDLFLLENQIPFKVLSIVMKLMNIDCSSKLSPFIYGNLLSSGKPKRNWFGSRISKNSHKELICKVIEGEPAHLLQVLHRSLTKKVELPTNNVRSIRDDRCTFRNVNELVDVGIRFKPSETMSLAHIEFFKGKFWSANVKLAPITVDDSTKPMLLNLTAYEMCARDGYDAPVTSYICLLDSLIDHPEDVKTLRKAGVLENSLGSDKEVAKLFNEIGTDLVPDNLAYLEAKRMIQRHYDSWRNTLISELKHEYVKSPWAFIALLGALMVLFLACVQTYYSVWSPKGPCDDLCKFLKMNHHL